MTATMENDVKTYETNVDRKARHIECTLEEYHQRPEWSRSQLEVLRESPPLFHGLHVAKPPLYPRERKEVWDIGTVAHALLSMPADRRNYLEIPAEVLAKGGSKAGNVWKQFKADHPDTILLKSHEFRAVKQMIENVYAHPQAGKLLEKTLHCEFSLIYEDQETDLPLRARPDLILGHRDQSVIVVDFKTTKAVTPREFVRDAVKFGYHRQEDWYSEAVAEFGYHIAAFLFITSDKSPAHECRVYELPPRAKLLGAEENRMNRRDLARRLKTNEWTDRYGKEILTVDLPEWAYEDPWRT